MSASAELRADQHPAASERHGAIVAHLAFLLGLHLKRSDGRGRVVVGASVVPDLWADRKLRVPALAITFAPPSNEDAVRDPCVVIEIFSGATEAAARDRVWAYMSIATLGEIILLSDDAIGAEALRRDADGAWAAQPEIIERSGQLTIEGIGFARRLSDVYETTDLRG
jgi:Uma2 family endonuclease